MERNWIILPTCAPVYSRAERRWCEAPQWRSGPPGGWLAPPWQAGHWFTDVSKQLFFVKVYLEEIRAQQCGRGNKRGVNRPIWLERALQNWSQILTSCSWKSHLLSCFLWLMPWMSNPFQDVADLTMSSKLMIKPDDNFVLQKLWKWLSFEQCTHVVPTGAP